MRTIVTLTVAALGLSGPGQTAELASRQVLTLDGARRIVAAAEVEAARNGWPCVVAVVDSGGWLLTLERMDAAPMLASVDLAPGKARAAAAFGKPTSVLESGINKGRIAQVTAGGYTQMQGGLPIVVDGTVVGAIGVSADLPAHDEQIAEAGSKALSQAR